MNQNLEIATFGAGCFWCVEAIFSELRGVNKVYPGYTGGHKSNPTYQEVCSGTTGHAEVIRIEFDPALIKYQDLVEVFFQTHDPTTLNRQGNDIGTQYRSVIYYHNEIQKDIAQKAKEAADESGSWDRAVITEISEATEFFRAEKYHENYFKLNPNEGYCRIIIAPKVEKFKKKFQEKLS